MDVLKVLVEFNAHIFLDLNNLYLSLFVIFKKNKLYLFFFKKKIVRKESLFVINYSTLSCNCEPYFSPNLVSFFAILFLNCSFFLKKFKSEFVVKIKT